MGRKLYVGNLSFSVTDNMLLELFQQTHASDQAAGQSIQPVNHSLIHLTISDKVQKPLERRAIKRGPGKALIIESLLDERPAQNL